jgi:diadenosine tetraphosphate (Ap4A) HIT family hydrolase
MTCLFCNLPKDRIKNENDSFIVVRDNFPISKGHTLIIPKRHIASFFELETTEFEALKPILDQAKKDLDTEFNPQSYNIGINDGECAGQTINHLHVHLIPRYKGDQENPKGGIRWIFPDKAKYWN